MKIENRMIRNFALVFFAAVFLPFKVYSQSDIKNEILKHGEVVRKAFYDSDIEKIKGLHHPDVIKALGYNDLKVGRDEVINALKTTLKNFNLEFIKNDVEHIFIEGNIAIEQTKFSIKLIPKNEGDSFVFKGRTMVTYIRYDKSPTGWATIREMIQPASE